MFSPHFVQWETFLSAFILLSKRIVGQLGMNKNNKTLRKVKGNQTSERKVLLRMSRY